MNLSPFLVCDSRGIQTHNLLIRSQMLYSVELGSHPLAFFSQAVGLISELRVQRYGHFLKLPNFSSTFFIQILIFANYKRKIMFQIPIICIILSYF